MQSDRVIELVLFIFVRPLHPFSGLMCTWNGVVPLNPVANLNYCETAWLTGFINTSQFEIKSGQFS